MNGFPPVYALHAALRSGSRDNLLPGLRDPGVFRRHGDWLRALDGRIREKWAAVPAPPLRYSDFSSFLRTGERRPYERPLGNRRARLADYALAVAAGEDLDGSRLRELEDLLWELCDESTWCMPAHLWPATDSDRERHAEAYPRPLRAPRRDRWVIDLGAAVTGHMLAEILHILGDRVSPDVAARCHAEIRDRILDSFLSPAGAFFWQSRRNNWSAVCAGSVAATFLYEETDPDVLFNAMVLAFGALEAFLSSFSSEGLCLEGLGYWCYGFGHYVIDLFRHPMAHDIALFPQRAALSETRGLSFSDGHAGWRPPSWLCHRLRQAYPDIPLPPVSTDPPEPSFAYALRDFLWTDPDARPEPYPDGAWFYPGAQWFVARSRGLAFAAKFGANDEPHNHNDIGTFLLLDHDREGPTDTGSGVYNRAYFSPARYLFTHTGSHGHSVPILDGRGQFAGEESSGEGKPAARDVSHRVDADGAHSIRGDLAPVYRLENLERAVRTFRFDPASNTLVVTDDIRARTDRTIRVVERFVGFEKPEILEPGRALFGAFDAAFDPALEATVLKLPDDSDSPNYRPIYALDIATSATSREAPFAIRFTPRGG